MVLQIVTKRVTQGTPVQQAVPKEPHFRSAKNVADAKLVRYLVSHACMTLRCHFLMGSSGNRLLYGLSPATSPLCRCRIVVASSRHLSVLHLRRGKAAANAGGVRGQGRTAYAIWGQADSTFVKYREMLSKAAIPVRASLHRLPACTSAPSRIRLNALRRRRSQSPRSTDFSRRQPLRQTVPKEPVKKRWYLARFFRA